MAAIKLKADGKVILTGDGKVACECCPPVGPTLTVTCTSQTATPTLCGYSAYEDENAGPEYKWQTRTLEGDMTLCYYDTEGCTGTILGGFKIINSGACAYSGCTKTSDALQQTYTTEDCSSYTLSSSGAVCSLNYFSTISPVVETFTRTTREISVSGCDDAGDGSYISVSTTGLKETLSDPDTIEAAIARETPVEGASCCAVTGIIGTTTAASDAPIAVGESTSVTMALSITGGTPSTDYVLTITFKNYVDSTSTEEAETTLEIELTTDVAGEWADDVAIPQPDSDHRRCYDRYTLDLA